MKKASKVSVIMSVYNEKTEWLKQSIESILNQTYANIEFIIILDNPNNFELKGVIERYKEDERIKFSINDMNRGLVYSLNKAIKMCTGNYIARMDADDISLPNRIEKQITYLFDNNLDIVGSNVINMYPDGKRIYSHYPITPSEINLFLCNANALAHPTWLLKKECYHKVGMYRNIYSNEDYDFLLRCKARKMLIGNIEEPLLIYRISPNGITQSNLYKQRLVTNYLAKNQKTVDKISERDIDGYLKKRYSEQRNRQFYLAYQFANKSSFQHSVFKRSYYRIRAILTSFDFFRLNYMPKILRRVQKCLH